jgi:AbiU2
MPFSSMCFWNQAFILCRADSGFVVMVDRTAGEIKAHNIEKMGPELGAQFSELWQRVVKVHVYWGEFIEMFRTKPSRLDVMNESAPAFFYMLRTELADMILLQLSRVTDKPVVAGHKTLTIRNLPSLIVDDTCVYRKPYPSLLSDRIG